LKVPMSLFGSFRPTDWREEVYTKNPPFMVENVSGRVFVVPRDLGTESALDGLTSSLGLKKAGRLPIRYSATRGNGVKGLREFDWYVRRSWHDDELSVLWALAYLGEKGDWVETSLQLSNVAEVAGLTAKDCSIALQNLFRSGDDSTSIPALAELSSDRRLIQQTIEKKVSELPIWTEELVMSALCASSGCSISELYEAVLTQGLSIGAVYKVSERLKLQGYVYTRKHYRVNQRGPMREMLTADCRNCFYGYSGPEGCLADTLRQMGEVLERDYGRRPTKSERDAFYISVKSVPYACRASRRALRSLKLMHEIDALAKEELVSSILKKIEDRYGVDLPIKASPG